MSSASASDREPLRRSCGETGLRELRIGIVCHPTYGGSGVVASELALSLAARGHSVHLFSYNVPPRMARSAGPVEMHVAQGIPYPLFQSIPFATMLIPSDVFFTNAISSRWAFTSFAHASRTVSSSVYHRLSR